MQLTNTYLARLYQYQHRLFWIVLIGISGILLPIFIGFEITPFFDWRMYAYPMHQPKNYVVYQLTYNNGKIYNEPHTWKDYSRMMIDYTLPHYAAIKEQGDTLPFNTKTSRVFLKAFSWNHRENHLQLNTNDLNEYTGWLKRYLQQQTGEIISQLSVQCIFVHYNEQNQVVKDRTETVLQDENRY